MKHRKKGSRDIRVWLAELYVPTRIPPRGICRLTPKGTKLSLPTNQVTVVIQRDGIYWKGVKLAIFQVEGSSRRVVPAVQP